MHCTLRCAVVLVVVTGCQVVPETPALHDGDTIETEVVEDSSAASHEANLPPLMRISAAAQALTDGKPQQALDLLHSASLELEPDATAKFLAGVAYLQLGNAASARTELEAAVALDPADISTRCVLARACEESGDLDAAVEQLQGAVERDDSQARLFTLLGHLQLEREDIGSAYNALLKAVELDPSDADAHRGLAVLFLRAGNAERAEQAFRQAINLLPDDALLHAGLGNALHDLGRLDEALASYREAARLEPDNPVHRANEASTLFSLGRLREARTAFEQTLSMPFTPGPRSALVHYDFATLLQRLGDASTAADEYQFAIEDDPEFASGHEALGLLWLDQGRKAEAARHLETALDLAGLGAESMLRLGLLHEERGEVEGARRCARLLAAAAANGDPSISFRHAQLLVLSNDAEIRDPEAAIKIVRGLLGDRADALTAGSSPASTAPADAMAPAEALLAAAPPPTDSTLADPASPDGAVAQGTDGALWNLLGEAFARQGSYEEAVQAAEHALRSAAPGEPAWQVYSDHRTQYLSRLVNR